MFDPDGEDTIVALRANPIGRAPGVGTYGHAFVQYTDTETGESRISRAGPSAPYPGGSRDAITNRSFDGVNIEAIDTPAEQNIDFGQPGAVEVMSVTVEGDIGDVQSQLGTFNEQVNESQTPYQPRGPNSNTYAGDAFQHVTGQAPENDTDVSLPGLNNDIPLEENR